jgi:hypothetical protein
LSNSEIAEQLQQEDFQKTVSRRERAEQFDASQKATQQALRNTVQ